MKVAAPDVMPRPQADSSASAVRLDRTHPLAEVAAKHCSAHRARPLIGGVACGPCWERAIRDDERVVVEHNLPRELVKDATDLDEVAIDLACHGKQVRLTDAERIEAVGRMRVHHWLSISEICQRLWLPADRVITALTEYESEHAVRLYLKGWTPNRIARRLQMPVARVYAVLTPAVLASASANGINTESLLEVS